MALNHVAATVLFYIVRLHHSLDVVSVDVQQSRYYFPVMISLSTAGALSVIANTIDRA